ncbi:MAG: pilus assembly PilX family protein [Myxococcales bacterium]
MEERERTERGMAMLIVMMIILGLMVVGALTMVVMDNVTRRSGSFRRTERSQYCAEEGLNLGRAWVAQYAASGSLPTAILSGTGKGDGLLTDPTNPLDFGQKANGIQKDLCEFAQANIGGTTVYGLQGICRTDPALTYCGAPPCSLYRINLIDDIDEPPSQPIDPFTDENQTFLIRAECMDNNYRVSAVAGCAVTSGGQCIEDEVASAEVAEAGGGCSSASTVGVANPAGCGVGNK